MSDKYQLIYESVNFPSTIFFIVGAMFALFFLFPRISAIQAGGGGGASFPDYESAQLVYIRARWFKWIMSSFELHNIGRIIATRSLKTYPIS